MRFWRVPHVPRRVSVSVALSPRNTFNVESFLNSPDRGKIVRLQRHETIFTQGGRAKNVIYIREGGVRLTVANAIGKEAVIAILGPGDFAGEGCLAGQTAY